MTHVKNNGIILFENISTQLDRQLRIMGVSINSKFAPKNSKCLQISTPIILILLVGVILWNIFKHINQLSIVSVGIVFSGAGIVSLLKFFTLIKGGQKYLNASIQWLKSIYQDHECEKINEIKTPVMVQCNKVTVKMVV